MSRRLARETCFKLMFEYEFLRMKNDITLEQFLQDDNLEQDDRDFVVQEYEGMIKHNDQIVEIIEKNLNSYTINRIYKVDMAILKLAVYEIKFSTLNTPSSVVINEAVELAKKYSTDKSYGFVNGILASVVKDDAKASN